MNKKILAMTLVIAMLALIIVGGTMAYFVDTDQANNVFVIGNVQIDQHEYERVKDANGAYTTTLQSFTQKQKVFPAVYELPGGDPARMTGLPVGEYTVNLGIRTFPNYIDKIVTVENTGNSDAYVRTIIAVPVSNDDDADGNVSESWLHWNCISSSDTAPASGWYYGTPENREEYPSDYAEHYIVRNVLINGKLYDLTVVTNINALPAGETTAPNMIGFYLDNDLQYDEDGYYMPNADGSKTYVIKAEEINENGLAENLILVATQAVQTEGFADAWQAFAASFGEINEANHPWAE